MQVEYHREKVKPHLGWPDRIFAWLAALYTGYWILYYVLDFGRSFWQARTEQHLDLFQWIGLNAVSLSWHALFEAVYVWLIYHLFHGKQFAYVGYFFMIGPSLTSAPTPMRGLEVALCLYTLLRLLSVIGPKTSDRLDYLKPDGERVPFRLDRWIGGIGFLLLFLPSVSYGFQWIVWSGANDIKPWIPTLVYEAVYFIFYLWMVVGIFFGRRWSFPLVALFMAQWILSFESTPIYKTLLYAAFFAYALYRILINIQARPGTAVSQ